MVAHVFQFANGDVKTTLNQGGTLNSGSTSFVVTSASGFPSSGDFYVLFDKNGTLERVKVTAVSGTTFTCAATASNHADGVSIDLVVTAEMLLGLWDCPSVLLTEEQAANTGGGTFTTGAWRTRTLNTKVDPQGVCALASNQFTPASGTYLIIASAPAWKVDRHGAKLYNATGAADVLQGTSEFAGADTSGTHSRSWVLGRFTANGTDAYEIQHQAQTTAATYGFGVTKNFAVTEVYAAVLLLKVA